MDMDTATNTGADEMQDEAVNVGPMYDNSHDDALEAIVAAREAQEPENTDWAVDDEGGGESDKGDDEPHGGERPASSDEPTIEFLTDDGRVIRVPATAKFKAKVDGSEEEADLDRLTRSYQKGAAADRRLEEAARAKKELEESERSLAARLQAVKAAEEAAATLSHSTSNRDEMLRSKAGKLYDALMDGGDDPVTEIASALGEMIPNPEEITRRAEIKAANLIEERERARERKAAQDRVVSARNEANAWFTDEYQDIVSDPVLVKLAQRLGEEKVSADPNRDPKEVVREIGEELRTWVSTRFPKQGTQRPHPPQSAPRARRGSVPAPLAKPQTRADILAEMRKDRGQ